MVGIISHKTYELVVMNYNMLFDDYYSSYKMKSKCIIRKSLCMIIEKDIIK